MVEADDAPNYARKLGVQRDQVVQEWGWDEDTDDDIRAAVTCYIAAIKARSLSA